MTTPRGSGSGARDPAWAWSAPVQPMLAAPASTLPAEPGWAYEPKFDGWRAIAIRRPASVLLLSRSGKALSAYFPDITRTVQDALPAGVIIDGELVIWERDRISFDLLRQRIAGGGGIERAAREHPAHYVVFDLLHDVGGADLLDEPLARRRQRLAALLADAPARLVLCPQTTDLAQATQWLSAWSVAGVEGVVAKRLDGRYRPGRRGWVKCRARSTTEAVIGGVTGTIDDPETLLLGRYDGSGQLRYAGRSRPLSTYQRHLLAPLLTPAEHPGPDAAGHPWPQPLPARWTGQFDHAEPLPYVQVRPTVVAEIEVDSEHERHRWRHPVRYVRTRDDLRPSQLPRVPSDDQDPPPKPYRAAG